MTLSGLTVNGDSTFTPATTFNATAAQNYWTLSGYDLTSGFTITGTIGLSGAMSNNEGSQVELIVGQLVPEPGSLAIWAVGGCCIAGLRRRRR